MKLRSYLASLVVVISYLPSENDNADKHIEAKGGLKDQQDDPMPYGIPVEKQAG
jgi:hypothetical protein